MLSEKFIISNIIKYLFLKLIDYNFSSHSARVDILFVKNVSVFFLENSFEFLMQQSYQGTRWVKFKIRKFFCQDNHFSG